MSSGAISGIASGSLKRDDGYILGGAGGYKWGPWRGEIELEYMENSAASGTNLFAGATGHAANLRGSTSNLAFMLNGYYDIPTGWPVTPYVGLGIGADYFRFNQVTTTNLSPNVPIANSFATVFAYQPIVGVSYAVNAHWSLNLEYRYFGTTDPNIKYSPNPPQRRFSVNNASHNVMASVTFHFFEPPPPPPETKANLVVVLPEANGHVGAVVVHGADNTTVLNQAYAAVGSAAGSTAVKPVEVAPAEVSTIFGQALAAQPNPPRSFTLYFRNGSTEITPDSRATFEQIYADIKQRGAAEIVVTGHTDTIGTSRYNDALSLRRARRVQQMLVERGVPANWMTIVGAGKRDLAVSTRDQVREPQNRRVVIDAK
jgi:outer membrane protein OmpA-like peptidoglycan-associated protein/opacity protein-like surface antigen